MWIMTFIAEYFNDISTAQYEEMKTLLQNPIISVFSVANILWLCLTHPESSLVFYLLTHHVTSY